MGSNKEFIAYGLPFRSHDANSLSFLLDSGDGNSKSIHFVAASTITSIRNNVDFAKMLSRGILIADSRVVLKYLSLKFGKFRGIRGTDFMRHYLGVGSKRYFLIGANDTTTNRLIKRIGLVNPNAICVGVINPEYKEDFSDNLSDWVNLISESRTESVWVGMGSPKQDVISSDLSRNLALPVIAVGAAFDFIAGTKVEAPRFFQALMLEWLFRFISEPRRLWKRYLLGNIFFAGLTIMDFGMAVSKKFIHRD